MRCIGLILLILCLAASVAEAVDIQFELASGRVTGVSDTPLPSVPGYGLVTLVGSTAAQIQWPVPSGCTAGRPQWSIVSDPDGVTVGGAGLALRAGLAIFHTTSSLFTGCREVASWTALRTFVEQTIIATMQQYPLLDAVTTMNVVTQAVCPTGTPTACADARTKMAAINNTATLLPGPAALNSFLGEVTTLKEDAISFRGTQCSAGNQGFCP